jgi:glycosyltransferase involved in cell wall biosynthesis
MEPPPIVSIIIPAFQVASYVADTLRSVVDQTFRRWEAIVINDGSPDTAQLEQALAPYTGRIRYITQPNMGAAAARNAGFRAARGEWLAFLDGDDCWLPSFLEKQLALLRDEHLDMVWSDGFFFGDTKLAGSRLSTVSSNQGIANFEGLLSARINVNNSSTIIRRSLVDAVGHADETIRRGQDFDLWARLFARGVRARYNPEPLFRYRIRPGNLTGDVLSQADRELDVLSKLRNKNVCNAAELAVLDERLRELRTSRLLIVGKRMMVERNYVAAASQFREALAERSTIKLKMVLWVLQTAPALLRAIYLARTSAEYR